MPEDLPINSDRTEARPSPPQAELLPPSPAPGNAAPRFSHVPGFSKKRLVLAFAIAAVSDGISAFASFATPIVWVVDLVTVALLFAVLGWSWFLLPGLVMEAIPGLDVLPFWILVVMAIAGADTARQKVKS
jgi:hypothetical protein